MVTSTYLGPPPPPKANVPPATPKPTPTPSGLPKPTHKATIKPLPVESPAATALPTPYPNASARPPAKPVSKTVDIYGNFKIPMQLAPGKWLITVAGTDGKGHNSTPITRVITVRYSNVLVTIKIAGGPAGSGKTAIAAWKDDGAGMVQIGKTKNYAAGTTLSLVGIKSVKVQTNCLASMTVTVNGWPYSLGRSCSGAPLTFLFTATAPPKRVSN